MKTTGKLFESQQRRSRICPICGKKFDAKNKHIVLCNRCKQMIGKRRNCTMRGFDHR